MYEDIAHIKNSKDVTISVWVEPWAFDVEIPAGQKAKFLAKSEIDGALETEMVDGKYVIYAWPCCNLTISINGNDVWCSSCNAVPSIPNGTSIKDFIKSILRSAK